MNPELAGYLLGTLPEDRREAIAQQMIIDPDLFRELEILEVDLIDRYARGELDSDDAMRVRSRLLSSQEGANELRVARALASCGMVRRSAKSHVRMWAAAAVATLLLGSALTWFVRERGSSAASRLMLEPAPVAVILDLSAVRGNARVPQLHIPRSGPVLFVMRTDAKIPDGAIAHLRTPDRRDLNLPIRAGDQSFRIRGAAPLPGRYEVEVTRGQNLIAAGEFDLVP